MLFPSSQFDVIKAWWLFLVFGLINLYSERFLSERSFKVRVGSTLSDLHAHHMGVPQGSILPPALLSIKINNIVKAVLKSTNCALFVDDNRVETAMQMCVNSVKDWVSENGFKFFTSKTVCIHFHQQYVCFFSPPRPYHPSASGENAYNCSQRSEIPWSHF